MLKAVEKIVRLADDRKIAFPEAVLILDAAETGVPAEEIRGRMAERLADMRRSVREACANTVPCRIEPSMGPKLRSYQGAMSGDFILAASATAMEVASYNATMGRIVAAPTAGSCGIILFKPGVFQQQNLAGAQGGCQAECGAAAAMGSAALAFLQGGTPAMSAHAAAMTFKSVLGLACDPVGGLVECPCIKRNGILVANGTLCADMALAGIESVIPLDEVIGSMGQIGRMMAPALRETSQGGLAVTPTAVELMKAGQERIGG